MDLDKKISETRVLMKNYRKHVLRCKDVSHEFRCKNIKSPRFDVEISKTAPIQYEKAKKLTRSELMSPVKTDLN